MKLLIDEGLEVEIKSLMHNSDENSVDIVIVSEEEESKFTLQLFTYDVQALPHSNRIWTVYYYTGFKITE